MAQRAPQQLPLPLNTGAATVVIKPSLTPENLREPEVRQEIVAIVHEAMAGYEDKKRKEELAREVTGKEAARDLGVGRTTFYRGIAKIPDAELATARAESGRWRWSVLEALWERYVGR
jgi:hypothetical protein